MRETHESGYDAYVRCKREQFYHDMLGMPISLSSICIPERPAHVTVPIMPLVVHYGLFSRFKNAPIEGLFRLYRSYYCGKKYANDPLDKVITDHDRSSEKASYVIWVENRVEVAPLTLTTADTKWHSNETILERLLHGLYFAWRSKGRHLDVREGTLCEASRDRDGAIPVVDFYEGVRVSIIDPGDRNRFLRPRKVWL